MSQHLPAIARPEAQVHNGERSNLVAAPEAKALTVCLIDDDQSMLKATRRLLSSAGWKVDAFDDPFAFLEHAKTCQPRVVVLDILMPKMNGLEVQKRLKTISPASRVVVLTSKDDPSVRAQAMGNGASAFFLKPVSDSEFLAGVDAAFSNN